MPGTGAQRLRAAAALALVAAFGAAGGSLEAVAAEGEGQAVVIRPADPRQVWLKLDRPRGSRSRAPFVVLNPTRRPQPVLLYTVDAKLERSTGAFTLADEAAPRQDVGAWATLPVRRLVLAPRARRRIELSLAIPEDASPGLHLGGVVVQGPGRLARRAGSGEQIRVVTRLGLRLYLRVPAGETERARLSEPSVRPAGWGTPLALRLLGLRRGRRIEVAARLANPSARPQAELSARLEVRRGGGPVTATPWRRLAPLAPGASRPLVLRATYRGWHRGGYRARIVVRDGVSELSRELAAPRAPWGPDPLGLVGLTLVGALLGGAIRARRRRHG
jgi:hypothetical protein